MVAEAAASRKDPREAKVSDYSTAWAAMRDRNELVEALLGGTERLRQEGETYLPRYAEEEADDYQNRLERSVLTNFFRKSLRTLGAKPFIRPMSIKKDTLASGLEPLLEDCDLEGNSLHVFSHRAFKLGLGKGLSHILVDFPRVASPDGTALGQQSSGARPYFRMIAPENVIAAYADNVNGEERYTHVRIRSQAVRRVSQFGEGMVETILVMEPGRNELWVLVDPEKELWRKDDEWNTGIDFVPLVTYYSERTGFLEAEPPLLDVAYLNITHWQAMSDQINILSVARFPILAASGVTNMNDSDYAYPNRIRVGPRQVYTTSDPQSRVYYVEHTGAAIASGAAFLADLADQMALLSMELVLRGRAGRITATAHAIDKAEADTALGQMAVDFEEAINQALRYANAWNGGSVEESAGKVQLASDFGLTLRETEEIRELIEMRKFGFLTEETLLRELKRRQVLSDDFDVAEEILAISKMPPPLVSPTGGTPPPSSPPPDGTDPGGSGSSEPLRAVQ